MTLMGGFPYRAHLRPCTWGIAVQKPFWQSAGCGVGFLPCSSLSCPMNEEIHSLVFLWNWTLNIKYVWFERLLNFLSLILGLVCLPSISYLKQFSVVPISAVLLSWLRCYDGCPVSFTFIFFAPNL